LWVTLAVQTLSEHYTSENIAHVDYNMFAHELQRIWPIMTTETEGVLKVTGNHVHCDSRNVSEMMQEPNKKSNMAHRIWSFPMTLSHRQGHSTVANHFKQNFSYSCTPVDQISTAVARRAGIQTREL